METTETQRALRWVHHDGGREAAGYRGQDAGDCVVRAIAIAAGRDYDTVYRELAWANKQAGGKRSARDGFDPKVYKPWLTERGWNWTATVKIGQGCTVHLAEGELPDDILIVRLSKHLTAVIDGVVYDNHDPTREGTRCVYGYWSRA